MDHRKSIKASPLVKKNLRLLKSEINVKTESQIIAYLLAMYHDQKEKGITLADHRRYLKVSEDMHHRKQNE